MALSRKDQQIRDQYFRRKKKAKYWEAQLADADDFADRMYPEMQLRTLRAQIAETEKAGLPQTAQSKRGGKRKEYSARDDVRHWDSSKSLTQYLRRQRKKREGEEESRSASEVWEGLDYMTDIQRLSGAIRQAKQDNDKARVRALKRERAALPSRYPLIWREWLRNSVRNVHFDIRTPALKLAHEAAKAYVSEPEGDADHAEKLLADIWEADRQQLAAWRRRKNITVIERSALRRLCESLGIPFKGRTYECSWTDSPAAFLEMVR